VERLIVDTGVLIAAERRRIKLPDLEGEAAIAAITASELLLGVELAAPDRRDERAAHVERVLRTFEVLELDLTAARHHARLAAHTRRTGGTRGAHDLIIAATASATGRMILTTDTRGFRDLPGVSFRLLTSM
jgi:tRNA(fMet)-specific endonuclease VapC